MVLLEMAPNAAPRLSVLAGLTTQENRVLSTPPSLELGKYKSFSFFV